MNNDTTIDGIQLNESERQRCEVWTRVMGYYRPTSFFNVGKQGEHEERVHFDEGITCAYAAACYSDCLSCSKCA